MVIILEGYSFCFSYLFFFLYFFSLFHEFVIFILITTVTYSPSNMVSFFLLKSKMVNIKMNVSYIKITI